VSTGTVRPSFRHTLTRLGEGTNRLWVSPCISIGALLTRHLMWNIAAWNISSTIVSMADQSVIEEMVRRILAMPAAQQKALMGNIATTTPVRAAATGSMSIMNPTSSDASSPEIQNPPPRVSVAPPTSPVATTPEPASTASSLPPHPSVLPENPHIVGSIKHMVQTFAPPTADSIKRMMDFHGGGGI